MSPDPSTPTAAQDHLRFHAPHLHLSSVFGGDWFGRKAETFARFFGTPTFLIAQTRQADRDKAMSEADAQHREALSRASLERQEIATHTQEQILRLLEQNTELTRITQELTERVEALTRDIHSRTCAEGTAP